MTVCARKSKWSRRRFSGRRCWYYSSYFRLLVRDRKGPEHMPIGCLHKTHELAFFGVNLHKDLAKLLRHQKGDIFLLSSLAH